MLKRENIENITALTPLQEGMLFHTLHNPERCAYVEQLRMTLAGDLTPALFAEAWEILCDRHEMLRSVFIHDAAKDPVRVVLKKGKQPVSIFTVSEGNRQMAELAAEDRKAMDLTRRETPFRIRLFCHGPDSFTTIWTFHHLLLDGWSVAVLQEELMAIYSALARGGVPDLPAPPRFSDYLKWCGKAGPDLDFWEKRLDGFKRPTPIPLRQDISEGFERGEAVRRLGTDRSEALRSLSRSLCVSLGALMRTAWALVLGGVHGVRDTVFFATVSGRPEALPGVEHMVGLFINALPQRICWDADTSAHELARRVQARQGDESVHQHASLAAIQAKSPLGRTLSDHIFVFENYPAQRDGDTPWQVVDSELFEHTHYDFELQVFPEEDIWLRARWNQRRHDALDVETLLDRLIAAADGLGVNTTADRLAGIAEPERMRLCLAATFTPDLLATAIKKGLAPFGYRPEIEDAGYNRLLAVLSDPDSAVSRSDGPVLLAFRLADLEKDLGADADIAGLLAGALKHCPAPGPFVVALMPASGDRPDEAAAWEQVTSRLAEDERMLFLDLREVPPDAGTGPVFDPVRETLGDLPFTDAFFGYAGMAVARTLLAWKRPPFKVIALDFDNTLWHGICGESGPEGVAVTPGHRFFQQFLKKKAAEGFLLVGLSKNNAADALSVFRQHPDMILTEADLVDWRISWEPKADGLADMAESLNLGADSFIFIDDSAVECSEMMGRMPEVLTVQMPADPGHIPAFLSRIWAFDRVRVTNEDRRRSGMYRAERDRQAVARKSDRTAFLRELQLTVFVAPATPAHTARSAQLSRRTNQFHCNPGKMSDDEVRARMADPEQDVLAIHVADRFGTYGQTGLVLCRKQADTLFVENFLLSCRVLGRGVEPTVLALLAQRSREHACGRLVFAFRKTEKNRPVLDFLFGAGGVEQDGKCVFDPSRMAGLPPNVRVVFDHPEAEDAEPETSVAEDRPTDIPEAAVPPACGIPFSSPGVNRLRLVHRADLLPLSLSTPADWEALVRSAGGARHAQRRFVAPKAGTETELAGIWREILGGDAPYGREDDFFACGGHSLSATRLASRIAAVFGVMLRLNTLFAHPRLRDMALAIEGARGDYRPIPVDAAAPRLSPAQERMAFLQALHPEDTAYNLVAGWWISGRPDISALEKSLKYLADRHENLRTLYRLKDGGLHPQVAGPATVLEIDDVSGRSGGRDRAFARMQRLGGRPFDLSREIPLRALWVKTGETEGLFVLVFHHIAMDGHAFRVLRRELASAYAAFSEGRFPECGGPPLRPGDYGAWMQARIESGDLKEDLAWWRSRLQDGPPPLDLPLDAPRPAVRRGVAGRMTARLSEADTEQLLARAGTLGATPFAFLVAVLKVLLYFDTGQEDIACGTVVSGRLHPDTEDYVGFVANTLVLRDRIAPELTFADFLSAVASGVRQAVDHGEYPFDRLVRELHLPADTSRSPLFDVMCVLQQETEAPLLPGFVSRDTAFQPGHTAFDLVFEWMLGDSLGLCITYDADLFSKRRMNAMAEQFVRLLRHAVSEPERPVARLNRLSSKERQRMLFGFQGEAVPVAAEKSIVQAFRNTVAAFGDRPAVCWDHGSVTYRELERQAAALAGRLVAEDGVRPGDVVAVCADRSLELVRGLLAVLMAGGVYLPLDPVLPVARVAALLDQAACGLLLSDAAAIPDGVRVRSIGEGLGESEELPVPGARGDAPAYLIFTSGSTGTPKGVLCRHSGFLNMIEDQIRVFGIRSTDRVLLFASPAFDASLSEIFMALLAGASLVPADRDRIGNIQAFPAFLADQGVSVATLPPVYLRRLEERALPLRVLITAGEAADPEAARRHAEKRDYFNAYGPTEYSVCTSIHKADPCGDYAMGVPIGKPIANSRVYILGPGDQPQPPGVPGEICVAGPGLALGYFGRKDLTETAFVPDPFVPGEKMYRTGDRGRWTEDGEICFLGRTDDQVKVRGVRVELGEIEAALCRHPDVRDAAVVIREHDGEKLLAAWVAGPAPVQAEELRTWLLERLPEPMVPARILYVTSLPSNTSGKVDRKALVLPECGPDNTGKTDGVSPEEAVMVAACRKILGRTPAPDADLFAAGLDSLRAMGLLQRFEQETGRRYSLMALYRFRSIRALLRHAEKAGKETVDGRPLLLLPPMPGLGLIYQRLAGALNGFSVFAPDFEDFDALTAAVRNCVAGLTKGARPILGGYSGGGNLAVRVASILEKEGFSFPDLILVDAWRRREARLPDVAERERLVTAYIRHFLPEEQTRRQNGALRKRAMQYLETVDGRADTDPISGRIHLLFSEDRAETAGVPGLWDRNWETLARGGFFRYGGSGTHDRMLEEPNLSINIQELKTILDAF